MQEHPSLVTRAARWSAAHRKTAILGWLAFVLVAIALGGAIGKKQMTTADQYPGESGKEGGDGDDRRSTACRDNQSDAQRRVHPGTGDVGRA